MKYKFSFNWFEKNIDKWKNILIPEARKKPLNILEIGVCEGAATTWFIDNLLFNGGTITCIDNFQGGIEHQNEDFCSILSGLEDNFLLNISKTNKSECVTIIKNDSFKGLLKLNSDEKKFDLIYIGGFHKANDALSDAALSWNILDIGGILIFDDYKWEKYQENYNNPRIAIDSFLSC